MWIQEWLNENWFTLLQSLGIIGSFLFTAITFRIETKTRRLTNLFNVTQNHRELWMESLIRPGFERVLETSVDVDKQPLKREEKIFINLVILHLNSVYHAMKSKLILPVEGLDKDVGWFFTLPLPSRVWAEMKALHHGDFVKYVECQVKSHEKPSGTPRAH